MSYISNDIPDSHPKAVHPAVRPLSEPEVRVLALLFELTEGGSPKYVVQEELLHAHFRKADRPDLMARALDSLLEMGLLHAHGQRMVTLLGEGESTIAESVPREDTRVVAFTSLGVEVARARSRLSTLC